MKIYMLQSEYGNVSPSDYPLHQYDPESYVCVAEFDIEFPEYTPLTKQELDSHFKAIKRASLLKQLEGME